MTDVTLKDHDDQQNIPDEQATASPDSPEDTHQATGNDVLKDVDQPHVRDQHAPSGTLPDPASDDDVDAMLAEVGLPVQDENNPQEIDTASAVDQAEQSRHNR